VATRKKARGKLNQDSGDVVKEQQHEAAGPSEEIQEPEKPKIQRDTRGGIGRQKTEEKKRKREQIETEEAKQKRKEETRKRLERIKKYSEIVELKRT